MRNLRTEQEIMANWTGDHTNPVASICCITYNHQLYIEDALEGFLLQETNFPFEIIIHDDASVDKTAKIVREYVKKYPNLIKPIYQSNNQYSINSNRPGKIALGACKGEFIALCEGDDYWVTADKLALQVGVMIRNENVSMVFSSAIQKQQGKKDFIRNQYPKEGVLDVDLEWVLKKGGGFYPTASMVFRSNILNHPPEWFWKHTTGDYPLAIQCRLFGEFYYIDKNLSVYNSHIESVSHRLEKNAILALKCSLDKRTIEIDFFDLLQKEKVIKRPQLLDEMKSLVDYSFFSNLAKKGIYISMKKKNFSLKEDFKIFFHYLRSYFL